MTDKQKIKSDIIKALNVSPNSKSIRLPITNPGPQPKLFINQNKDKEG